MLDAFVTINVADQPDIMAKLDKILAILQSSSIKETETMAAVEDLIKRVERNTDVTQSAVVLINGLRQELAAAVASGDWNQVETLSRKLDSNSDALAAAIAANTSAEPGGNTSLPQGGPTVESTGDQFTSTRQVTSDKDLQEAQKDTKGEHSSKAQKK